MQVINGADAATFKRISVGEIIEVSGLGRLPQWVHLIQDIATMKSFAKLAEAFGVDTQSDPTYRVMLGQMDALSSAAYLDETILMMTPHGAPGFTIFAKLQDGSLFRDKMLLENEITIVGKVIRQLAMNQKQDIVRLVPRLETIFNLAKKNNTKGPRGRIERPRTNSPLDEAIRYPALELSAIAVYQ